MEDVGICYVHFVYFAAKWYILWPFGTFCGHLVYFSRFGMLGAKKNLATLNNSQLFRSICFTSIFLAGVAIFSNKD
jgi:hypothetical protein